MRWDPNRAKRKKQRRKPSPAPKRRVVQGGSLKNNPFLRAYYEHQAVISGGLQKFLFFLVLATLLYAFVFGDGGAIRIISLKAQRASLATDVAHLELDVATLQNEVDRIKSDPFMMEKLGREKYGYIYEGDRVYKLVKPKKRRK